MALPRPPTPLQLPSHPATQRDTEIRATDMKATHCVRSPHSDNTPQHPQHDGSPELPRGFLPRAPTTASGAKGAGRWGGACWGVLSLMMHPRSEGYPGRSPVDLGDKGPPAHGHGRGQARPASRCRVTASRRLIRPPHPSASSLPYPSPHPSPHRPGSRVLSAGNASGWRLLTRLRLRWVRAILGAPAGT